MLRSNMDRPLFSSGNAVRGQSKDPPRIQIPSRQDESLMTVFFKLKLIVRNEMCDGESSLPSAKLVYADCALTAVLLNMP